MTIRKDASYVSCVKVFFSVCRCNIWTDRYAGTQQKKNNKIAIVRNLEVHNEEEEEEEEED